MYAALDAQLSYSLCSDDHGVHAGFIGSCQNRIMGGVRYEALGSGRRAIAGGRWNVSWL